MYVSCDAELPYSIYSSDTEHHCECSTEHDGTFYFFFSETGSRIRTAESCAGSILSRKNSEVSQGVVFFFIYIHRYLHRLGGGGAACPSLSLSSFFFFFASFFLSNNQTNKCKGNSPSPDSPKRKKKKKMLGRFCLGLFLYLPV